jgi:hypothetical protein
MFHGFKDMPLPHSNFLPNPHFSVTRFVKKVPKMLESLEQLLKVRTWNLILITLLKLPVVFLPMVSKRS